MREEMHELKINNDCNNLLNKKMSDVIKCQVNDKKDLEAVQQTNASTEECLLTYVLNCMKIYRLRENYQSKNV